MGDGVHLRVTIPVGLALLLSTAASAPAQDRHVLDDVSAPNTISSRTVTQLSFDGLDVAPDLQAHVFRLPQGGWGVSAAVFPGVVQLFDSNGAPAGTFGRSGQGPGELGGDVFAVTMRGKLWVVDGRNSRLSIFTNDLHYSEDRRLQMTPFFVAPSRDRGSVLVSGSANVGGMFYAVARISREQSADAFGDTIGRRPPPVSQWLVKRRMAAETAGDEVWAVAMTGGNIDVLRSSDLSTVTRLQLPGDEMAREAGWQLRDLEERPAPRLIGIAADSTGLLWLSFGVADSAWTPGTDPRDNVEKYFDTRVLVINPAKREIVGQLQLDDVCLPVESRLISCVDEMGETIRVVRLQLLPGEPRGQ